MLFYVVSCASLYIVEESTKVSEMLNRYRQQQIAQLVNERRQITVSELSQHFGVSEATIRRDLELLDSWGEVQRTHGGAVAIDHAASGPPIVSRVVEHEEEKKRIGRAAAQLIPDGMTVFLGSGTTTLEVARNLQDRGSLTVITNALNIACQLAHNQHIGLIIAGGVFRHSELSMIGHITEQALKELRADKVIMGMGAINIDAGLTNDHLPETLTDRAIIHLAPEVILVADHSKFNKVAPALVAPITAISTLVTDDKIPADILARIRQLGIEVILT
jgi:DeoR/GlpR family transcriptional regulator of sugar metabolism